MLKSDRQEWMVIRPIADSYIHAHHLQSYRYHNGERTYTGESPKMRCYGFSRRNLADTAKDAPEVVGMKE